MKKNKKSTILGISIAAFAALGGTVFLKNKLKKSKEIKAIEDATYVTGKTRKLGALYIENVKQHINDVKENKEDSLDNSDNIIKYEGGKIEILDEDKKDKDAIEWIEINEEGKKLLIAKNNILRNISWKELNYQNLVFGKVIKLGGRKYLLRLLTGSIEEEQEFFSEWDKYVLNVEAIEGLPLSSDEDVSDTVKEDEEEYKTESNNLWNWRNCCSFTQSEYGKEDNFCIIRGLYSAAYNNYCDKEIPYDTVGYRPVLELLD